MVVNPLTSANAALSYKLKVICNLSIAVLVFCFVVPVGGIVGFASTSQKAKIFTCGMTYGYHVFWVPIVVS